jgi:hypothetical protein
MGTAEGTKPTLTLENDVLKVGFERHRAFLPLPA